MRKRPNNWLTKRLTKTTWTGLLCVTNVSTSPDLNIESGCRLQKQAALSNDPNLVSVQIQLESENSIIITENNSSTNFLMLPSFFLASAVFLFTIPAKQVSFIAPSPLYPKVFITLEFKDFFSTLQEHIFQLCGSQVFRMFNQLNTHLGSLHYNTAPPSRKGGIKSVLYII